METLITKLKGSVNNDNLPKLGVITLKAKQVNGTLTSEQQYMRLNAKDVSNANPVVVSVDGNGYFTIGSSSTHLTSYNIVNSGSNADFHFSNGNYNVYISDKYRVTLITLGGYSTSGNTQHVLNLDLSMLSYATSFASLQASYHSLSGNIEHLAHSPLTSLQIANVPDVYGDISAFTELTNLNAFNSGVEGDLSDIMENPISTSSMNFASCPKISGNVASCAKVMPSVRTFNLADSSNIEGNFKDFIEGLWSNRNQYVRQDNLPYSFAARGTSCVYPWITGDITAAIKITVTLDSITCQHGDTTSKTYDGTSWT